ncbi:MAG: guaA [Gammaproteobacteria bacterium]|jgi:GMP synthase (glutamine-hydrolysing)|nr:guaA [Gammaproteobacteria bacterium]
MAIDIHTDRILILDFGSQYTQLIARCVRELGVYSEIYPYDIDPHQIKAFSPKGIILSGGPETVLDEKNAPRAPLIVFELGCPVLGICYGMQTMAAQLGGRVAQAHHREFGYARLAIHGHSPLLEGIADSQNGAGEASLDVWMSHSDHILTLPPDFITIASTENTPIAAMACIEKKLYGVQFHPEVTHTLQGKAILSRFIHDICGCASMWTASHIIKEALIHICEKVGSDEVLLGLSGGVDSSVVAALLHRAIGDQLTCVFVDNGLLRKGEADQVLKTFASHMHIKVIHVDAGDRFYKELAGIFDPEEKRRIIGKIFVQIFEEEAKKLKNVKWLAQGTIYPDVIESAGAKTGKAHVIKTHHNVGGLPETLSLSLLEPLRELFKDEVRVIGLELGLPHEMVYRHPFPGPGLAVRILGEVKEVYASILRLADAIFIEELHRWDLYHKVSQAFAVFLPVKSVGVVGDARQYEHVIALRAVETIDFMTAHWAELPYDFLNHVSNRILNEVKGISRVTYDISGKPPATIEWE